MSNIDTESGTDRLGVGVEDVEVEVEEVVKVEVEEEAFAEKLAGYIRDNLIGRNLTFQGPFGRRQVTRCETLNLAGFFH